MIFSRWIPAQNASPHKATLVFLHGLLGCGEDWLPVTNELTDYNCLLVELPGHGTNKQLSVTGFDEACQLISTAITETLPSGSPVILIGYSLGARLTMYGASFDCFSDVNIVGYLIEGGNFGLKFDTEKQLRLQHDQKWAECFAQHSIESVLQRWYQQPVFSSLTEPQRRNVIEKRKSVDGKSIANMLLATSLAKQPYLLDKLLNYKDKIHYVCGDKDDKFYQLARQSGLTFSRIKNAGHNTHQEQPSQFAKLVRNQSQLFLDTSKNLE